MDLVAEFVEPTLEGRGETLNPDGKLINTISQQEPSCWKAYIDGATNQRGSGVGLVLVSPRGDHNRKIVEAGFLRRE